MDSKRVTADARLSIAAAVAALFLAACSKPTEVAPRVSAAAPPQVASAPAAHAADGGIAWRHASSGADVDAAFAQARADAKPVFLYWGAGWCPPCNQVKATIFNRQDFIERSRAFVPVYIDGDSPGAQKLGARFRVNGYPTIVLFRPDGAELTRLPGEVDPQRYAEVVTLGMNARRPVKDVVADALGGAPGLAPNDWRLLAFYSWDQQQLVPKAEVPALLQRLSAACPAAEAESATRLWLKAVAASDAKKAKPGDAAGVGRLVALLEDVPTARTQFDVLANNAADLARALSARGTADRTRVVTAFDRVLATFEGDPTLSRADRLGALYARVDLAKIDAPQGGKPAARLAAARDAKIAPALVADVREQVARADREITDGYERQAVITAAADLLGQVGLIDESDTLLKSNLAKSHSPYYLMTELADNAAQRGDSTAALRWHREAYEKSEGPATRLQWGTRYLTALVELAPRDEATIERIATQLLSETGAQPNAFYERSARALRRVSNELRRWNGSGAHAAVLRRFDEQLGSICTRLDAADEQRGTCEALSKPQAKAAT